ncbi:chromosome segregation protein SMC [Frigidibacter albus]
MAQALPAGVVPLAGFVTVPDALLRRIGQIGLVDRAAGAALQAALRPGQRLVSLEGDLWRWDGFRAAAEDAPSAAALRLRQLNRLVELKRDLEEAGVRAEGARLAHEALIAQLAAATRADQEAREARRDADRRVAEASRAQSRAEADRSIAAGKLESARIARARHEEEAEEAQIRLEDAGAAMEDLPELETARAAVEDVKQVVEAARMMMMARRAAHDEARRDGEARTRRRQEITKEISGWRLRLDTAEKRSAELAARRAETAEELDEAGAAPEEIAAKHEELSEAIEAAEARRARAAEALAVAEAALRSAQGAEREAERLGSEAREGRARAEARTEAARETVAHAATRIFEETEPAAAGTAGQPRCRPREDARRRGAGGRCGAPAPPARGAWLGQPARRGGCPRGAGRA